MAEPLTPEEERDIRNDTHDWRPEEQVERLLATLDAARTQMDEWAKQLATAGLKLVDAQALAARFEREAMAWRAWYSRWPESAFYADGELWREVLAARAVNEEAERDEGR